jgi:hypothetical protein
MSNPTLLTGGQEVTNPNSRRKKVADVTRVQALAVVPESFLPQAHGKQVVHHLEGQKVA